MPKALATPAAALQHRRAVGPRQSAARPTMIAGALAAFSALTKSPLDLARPLSVAGPAPR